MKRAIATLFVLAACHSGSTVASAPAPIANGAQTGATDPMGAIRGFLAAAKQQDLQAMAALWGTAQGTVRDQMDRTELEKRELVMVCYLKHDKYDIVGDAPNPGGSRAAIVNMTLGDLTRSTTFDVVQGPSKRWYVENVDIMKLQDFCARRAG